MQQLKKTPDGDRWFVLRDLKRPNALQPAYRMLAELGVEIFLPMTTRIVVRDGRHIRQQVPYMQDMLFAHDSRSRLDPIVAKTPTLQYRFTKGAKYCDPMTVRDSDMEMFIRAVCSSRSPQYFRPEEITPDMLGQRIRIIGGALDGFEGTLLSSRGSRVKRIFVEIPRLVTVAVEVSPEYIQLIG